MENYPIKKPEVEPVPHTNPIEPNLPEITPSPEKTEPMPVIPGIEPMPKPEIEPVK